MPLFVRKEPNILDNLPHRLKALRLSNGFSQEHLAKLTGVAQGYISDLEGGKKMPSVEVLERLCDSLGGSADYLLGVAPKSYSAEPSCNISPGLLAEINGSGVTEDELKLALKVALLMRGMPAKA